MKALHLNGVAQSDMLYIATDVSRLESHVFAPRPITNTKETPVAFTKFGQGHIGYIGDVNSEDETHHVILAMCQAR